MSKSKTDYQFWYVIGGAVLLLLISRRIPEKYLLMLPGVNPDATLHRFLVMGAAVFILYGSWTLRKRIVQGIKGAFNPIRYFYYRHRARKDVRYMEIFPCRDTDTEQVMRFSRDFANMDRLGWDRIKKGRPFFRLHICWPIDAKSDRGPIRIYLGFPQDRIDAVEHTVKSVYPSARFRTITHDTFRQAVGEKEGTGGYFLFAGSKQKGLPLKSFHEVKHSSIDQILSAFRPGAHLDLIFSPSNTKALGKRNEEMIESLRRKKVMELDPYEQNQKKSLLKGNTGTESIFTVSIALWSNHKAARSHIQSIAKAIKSTMNHHGKLHFRPLRRLWTILRPLHPIHSVNPIPWPLPGGQMTLTDFELALLLHFPPGNAAIYDEPDETQDPRGVLQHVKINEKPIPDGELSSGLRIGTSNYPLTPERQLYLPHIIGTTHAVTFARTGFIKTALQLTMGDHLLEEWIKDDNAPGQFHLDPKGSGADIFMTRIRHREEEIRAAGKMDKIHFIDLTDPDYAFGMNLLHRNPGEDDQDVADNVMVVLESVFEELRGNGVLLSRFVRLAVETLLQDKSQKHTIFGVEKILTDPKFREKVKINDPELAYDWEINQKDIESKQKLESMINRFSRLRKSKLARRLFGQPRMSLNLRKIMDDGHIVVLRAGNMSDFEISLCLGFMANQLYVTAKNHRKRPKRNFYVFMDEAPLTQFGVIPRILSVSRDQGLCLFLIAQYAKQFKPEILDAIKGNVNTIFAGRQEEASAGICKEISGGYLEPKELMRLPKLTGAISTESTKGDRIQTVFRADPPFLYHPSGRKAFWTREQSGPEFQRMEREEREAKAWGRELGRKLQRRDSKRTEAVERWLNVYLGFDKKQVTAQNRQKVQNKEKRKQIVKKIKA